MTRAISKREDQTPLGKALEKCMELGCGRPLTFDGMPTPWENDDQLAYALSQNKVKLRLRSAASGPDRVGDWRLGNTITANSFKNLFDVLSEEPKSVIKEDAISRRQADQTRHDQQEARDNFWKLQHSGAATEEIDTSSFQRSSKSEVDVFLLKRDSPLGREWVLDEINKWRTERTEKTMLLIGDLGMGKSAIVALLAQQFKEEDSPILAYHSCRHDNHNTLKLPEFIGSLAAMLRSRLPKYKSLTDRPDIRDILAEREDEPVGAFEAGILAPLKEIEKPEWLQDGDGYIAIDALDETLALASDDGDNQSIATLLEKKVALFPSWLRLLATTQPKDTIVAQFPDAHPFKLEATNEHNLKDLRKYAKERLADLQGSPPNIIERLIAASEGTFLLLEHRINDILRHAKRPIDFDRLLAPTARYIEQSFTRYLGPKSAFIGSPTQRMLSAMAAAAQPLSVIQLAKIIQTHERDVRRLLSNCSPYVLEENNTYRIKHSYFSDYLRDARHGFFILERQGHDDIARALNEVVHSQNPTNHALYDYARPHGIYHLVKAERFALAIDWLTKLTAGQWSSISRMRLDEFARKIFIGLRTCNSLSDEARQVNPEALAELIRNYYEVEPLTAPLNLLVALYYGETRWRSLENILLGADNYCVRYALAEALADAFGTLATPEKRKAWISDLSKKLSPNNQLSQFELGAYALRLIYARTPDPFDSTDRRNLHMMAESATYVGRSALGDLLLDLALQGRLPKDPGPLLKDPRLSGKFWNPIWHHNDFDVKDIKAALIFSSPLPRDPQKTDALNWLDKINGWRNDLLANHRDADDPVRELLTDYFELGRDVGRIWSAGSAMAQGSDLKELMRLLLAHPLWAVAEAAATMFASLADERRDRISIVNDLLVIGNNRGQYQLYGHQDHLDEDWRVRYGAIETAFAIRHIDDASLFKKAVERFHGHAVSRIRALCAENLISMIVNAPPAAGRDLFREFEAKIRLWSEDRDCWVLEHVYRLTRRCPGFIERLRKSEASPLLRGKRPWHQLDREAFLMRIEKQALKEGPTRLAHTPAGAQWSDGFSAKGSPAVR